MYIVDTRLFSDCIVLLNPILNQVEKNLEIEIDARAIWGSRPRV